MNRKSPAPTKPLTSDQLTDAPARLEPSIHWANYNPLYDSHFERHRLGGGLTDHFRLLPDPDCPSPQPLQPMIVNAAMPSCMRRQVNGEVKGRSHW
jgi:hypothetical protein